MTQGPDISVCIPHLPYRTEMFHRALASVSAQTYPAREVLVACDVAREGAAATRNRALHMASSEYVAFLDDDDEMTPVHLHMLIAAAVEHDADLVYPWFDVPGGFDPFKVDGESPEGRPFDERLHAAIENECNFIPITVLVRREALMDLGGFPEPMTERWPHEANEDWAMWRELLRNGARFHHVPWRTWTWHWHGMHTQGQADRRLD